MTTTTQRIKGLDLMRGIAVGLVLLRHAWPSVFGGAGVVGVTIFFTLSGYLITGILVKDVEQFGRIRFGHFYRNRALRLIPALILLMSVITAVSLSLNLLHDDNFLKRSWIVALAYVSDFGITNVSPAIGHLWTLAIEEQFYVVWPFVIWAAYRFNKLKSAVVASWFVLVLSSIAMLIAVAPHWVKLYTLPTSWASAIVVGALLRILLQPGSRLANLEAKTRKLHLGAAIVILGALVFYPELKAQAWLYIFGAPLISYAAAVLIIELRTLKNPAKLLTPLVGLGRISYAAYLFNWPITEWLKAGKVEHSDILSILLTLTAATISWFALEKWVLAFKDKGDKPAKA